MLSGAYYYASRQRPYLTPPSHLGTHTPAHLTQPNAFLERVSKKSLYNAETSFSTGSDRKDL
jgi:hypothetical protein